MEDLRMLKNTITNNTTDVVTDIFTFNNISSPKKYKLAELTREDFAGNTKILLKYFRHDNRNLDRFHIPQINAKDYEKVMKIIKTSKTSEKSLKYENATPYFIRKVQKELIAEDLGCKAWQIDTTDYIWDERYYKYRTFNEAITNVDEEYRDKKEERPTSWENTVKNEPRTAVMDMELYEELYDFCIKAIQMRKAMLLMKVESCLSFLRNVLDYTYGFTQNPTQAQMNTLRSYKHFFENYLTEEVVAWLKDNDDVKTFADDPKTRSDYINAYRGMFISLSGTNELTESFRGIWDGFAFAEEKLIFDPDAEIEYTQLINA